MTNPSVSYVCALPDVRLPRNFIHNSIYTATGLPIIPPVAVKLVGNVHLCSPSDKDTTPPGAASCIRPFLRPPVKDCKAAENEPNDAYGK